MNTPTPEPYNIHARSPEVERLERLVAGHRTASELELDSIGRLIASARDIANSIGTATERSYPSDHQNYGKNIK